MKLAYKDQNNWVENKEVVQILAQEYFEDSRGIS